MSMAAHPMLPPLREGDYLTSDEFMRRWEAMPDIKHAELIDGIVYMPSPVSSPHGRFQTRLSHWLATYEDHTPGVEGSMEGTWLMGKHEVPQPDISFRILPAKGGQSKDEGQYTAGAPELIVEVAVSSSGRDLGVKLKMYERLGIQEYLVAVTGKEKLIWHVLTPSGYQLLEADSDGISRSRCFPGLWLDTAALWTLDKLRINAVLQVGLATPEHAAFVVRLAKL